MRTGRPKAPLALTEVERESLESLATRARTRPHLARRTRIIVLWWRGTGQHCGRTETAHAGANHWKWRGRFVRDRLDGHLDAAPDRRRADESMVPGVL
jgi:hypothetical protein